MRLALFQPDIPQNTGAALRLAACLGVGADVIEPCGFVWSADRMRRSGMDYLDRVDLVRHLNWDAFLAKKRGRLLLLTTKASVPYPDFAFDRQDILLVGRESVGAPAEVHAAADARLRIPMAEGLRSLNVVTAAAMVLGEALRQTDGFPAPAEVG